MHRGKPSVTVYTFELPEGRELSYPDGELWTLDQDEARSYAQEKGYQLIAWECELGDSELIEDFRPVAWHAETAEAEAGGDVGGDYQAGEAWQVPGR